MPRPHPLRKLGSVLCLPETLEGPGNRGPQGLVAELRPLVRTADPIEATSDHVAGTKVLISQLVHLCFFVSIQQTFEQLISATLCWALGAVGPRGPALRTPPCGGVRGAQRRGPGWS